MSITIEKTEKYLDKEPSNLAQELVKISSDLSNQLRKFYDEIKLIERKLLLNEYKNFKDELPLIKFMKSKIIYSAARQSNGYPLIPERLKSHLLDNIDFIKNADDFRNFILHFQAIISYYKYFSSEKQSNNNQSRSYNNHR